VAVLTTTPGTAVPAIDLSLPLPDFAVESLGEVGSVKASAGQVTNAHDLPKQSEI